MGQKEKERKSFISTTFRVFGFDVQLIKDPSLPYFLKASKGNGGDYIVFFGDSRDDVESRVLMFRTRYQDSSAKLVAFYPGSETWETMGCKVNPINKIEDIGKKYMKASYSHEEAGFDAKEVDKIASGMLS